MNSRQWKLHNLLEDKNRWVSLYEIANEIPEYKIDLDKNPHDASIQLRTDIDEMNSSNETEKTIIHNKNYDFSMVSTTNKEYADRYYEKLKVSGLKKLIKYYNYQRKISSNNQGKLVSLKGELITDESKARRFVESIISQSTNENVEDEHTQSI